MAWDRYAYGLNSPVRYVDPQVHWVCESKDRCDFRTEKQKEQPIPWQLKLIAMAVFAESANGTYPIEAMVTTADIALNRVVNPAWSRYEYPVWEAVSGSQFAISVLTDIDFPLPDSFTSNGGWSSKQELVDWVNSSWELAMGGGNVGGFLAALDATVKANNNPRGSEIYFSHQNDPVHHENVNDRHKWILDTAELRKAVDNDFGFVYYGPFWSTVQGYWTLLIGSNDIACGQYGSCGPPWPARTP